MPTVPSPALHMPNECAGEPGGGAALAPPRRPAALVLVTKPVQQGCRHHAGRRWIKVDPTERRGGGAAPVVALHGGPLPLRSCKGWCAVLLAALLPHVPGNQTGNHNRNHCAVPPAPPPPPPLPCPLFCPGHVLCQPAARRVAQGLRGAPAGTGWADFQRGVRLEAA